YPAYVPSLIGLDRVVEGNSKLAMSSSIAEVGGPSIAGALVQLFSAPFAILVDAWSYLVSALSLALIRSPEPARPVRDTTARVGRRIGLGPAVIWMAAGASAIGVLTPLAQGPLALATLMVFLPQLIGDGLQTVEGVAEISLVQGLIPDRILGRANATLEVISHGIAYPIGAVFAAAIADAFGVRGAMAIGWAGMASATL